MPKVLGVSDDEDSIPSGLDEDDDGDDESLAGLQDPEDSEDDGKVPSEFDEDEDDDKLSLVESSDGEDLIPFDEAEALAFKDGLIDWPGDEAATSDEGENEEWTGFGGGSPALGGKRKRKGGKEEQTKRKKARSLPTFASYEDYAKLIEEGPEDDI